MRILTGRSLWRALCWFLGLIFVLMTSFSVAPRAGFSVSADEGASPLVASSPILGGWTTYRSDDVDNLASAIAYNSLRGEYLVVWEDHYAAEVAIYARRVDSKGVALGGAIQVAHYSTYPSLQPDIAYSPVQDKYLVVYYQDSKPSLPPNVDYNIIGQPINGDGTKTETGFLIGGNTNNQRHPAVAYNADDDEFLVVWDEEQGEGGWKDIWAQRINALDWSSEPGPVCIATGGSKDRTEPDAAYNGTRGQYMIAYTRWEGDGDIFAKVLNSNLPDPLSITEIDIVYNTNLQGDVALAAGPDEYMVIWQDGPGISWRTIYARRVTGAGETPDPAFLIAEHANEVCAGPDVAYGRGFGYLTTWYYEGSPSTDTYGRYIQPGADAPVGGEFFIDLDSGTQKDPAVACAPSGDCLFVESDNSGSPDYEINGRTVNPHHLYLPMLKR